MENQNKKIANPQLFISENTTPREKEILLEYWEFKSNELVNKPKSVKEKFNLSTTDLNKLISNHAVFSFYVFCSECNSYEKQEAKSQTTYNDIMRQLYSRNYIVFKCDNCETERLKQIEHEKSVKHEKLINRMRLAVENKNWEQLTEFESSVLSKCLEIRFEKLKRHFGKILGQQKFILLIRALERIEELDLLSIQRNGYYNNYIISYEPLPILNNHKHEFQVTEKAKKEPANHQIDTGSIDTLKFKLTIDEFSDHIDKPKYSGLVKFSKKIVIEPNVDYVFGQWRRSNNELYLTLTPLDKMNNLPKQNRINDLPVTLQKGIRDFLNTMGKNIGC